MCCSTGLGTRWPRGTTALKVAMATAPTTFAVPQKQLEDPLAHLPCSSILEYRTGQIIYSQDQPSTQIANGHFTIAFNIEANVITEVLSALAYFDTITGLPFKDKYDISLGNPPESAALCLISHVWCSPSSSVLEVLLQMPRGETGAGGVLREFQAAIPNLSSMNRTCSTTAPLANHGTYLFADHVHRFISLDRAPSSVEGSEPEARIHLFLNRSLVLLHGVQVGSRAAAAPPSDPACAEPTKSTFVFVTPRQWRRIDPTLCSRKAERSQVHLPKSTRY
jgi:hypothetical protein